ncbi:diguanylate cyclase [Acerihabitans sp. TG2]|uniref:sensor domain-containing diguanylate cyclase n=1 Tax=Acerihabitans sp. TG2 TaxID=3096008 RepID=UPI002B22D3C1|nr:diguanylate cyclase [Acerihabitans sp. TG2]MEA9390102.1 diguanylate cyclase [Acerihabitans sp. TG2]
MIEPGIPDNEITRQATLDSLHIVDTSAAEKFDQVTRLAAKFFDVEMALISLIDHQRQWFLTCFGLEASETSRNISFCAHAILQHDTFIINDALADRRFFDNPLVTSGPKIRFYAGQPLLSLAGLPVGTLCIVDPRPRTLSSDEATDLRYFAAIIEEYLHNIEREAHTESIESDLWRTENLFKQTFSQAAVGMALVSLDGHWLRVNRRLCEMLRYSESEFLALTFQDITHPDDLDTDLDLLNKLLAGTIPTYSMEKRYFRSDKKIVWTQLTVSLNSQLDGSPHHFIAVIVNITERKEAEAGLYILQHELEERVVLRTQELNTVVSKLNIEIQNRINTQLQLNAEKERLRAITDNMPALISQVDAEETYLFANSTYMTWFGIDETSLKMMHIREFIGEEAYLTAKPMIDKVLSGQTVSFEHELRARTEMLTIKTILVPGETHGFYILSMDISELKRLQRHAEYEAMHDTLTVLPNRRAFRQQLTLSISESAARGQPMALLFLDLDGFKHINDTLGHDIGDLVLIHFAKILSGCVQDKGFVARLAGDEFTVILTTLTAPMKQLKQLCEEIMSQLSALTRLGETDVRLTVSIGAAIYSGDNTTGESLLSKADAAMYRAKSSGIGKYSID